MPGIGYSLCQEGSADIFEISPTVTIAAPMETVWEHLVDIEAWWVRSNPAHEALEILDDGDLGTGTRIRVEESIAGIPGVADGAITAFEPPHEITWEAPSAHYRYLGLDLTIGEGVSWELAPSRNGTELTARVWGRFPDGVSGKVFEWAFKYLLAGVSRDYEHAMTELEYLKDSIERDPR